MASLISPPAVFSPSPIHSDACLHGSFYFRSPFLNKPHSLSYSSSSSCNPTYSLCRPPDSTMCSCRSNSASPAPPSNSNDGPWFQQFFTSVAQKLEDFLNSASKKDGEVMESLDKEVDVDDWDWERWQRHFDEVEDQERLISILKDNLIGGKGAASFLNHPSDFTNNYQSQLTRAVEEEDFEDAARLKVAIAAVATKDTVGTVMSTLKKAIDDERYKEAIFVRDNAGAGLVGWWAGVSNDRDDPYGCIIRISAEHGRYVARSYSPRQLATSTTGVPLFEIFVTLNEKGEYKHQAVYLKRPEVSKAGPSSFPKSSAASSSMTKMNPAVEQPTDIFAPAVEDNARDNEDEDDPDLADGAGLQNLLQVMITGAKMGGLKPTPPDKVDQDLLSKSAEQIVEEDSDEKDIEAELDNTDAEDTEGEISSESEEEKDDGEMDDGGGDLDVEDLSVFPVKVVFNGNFVRKLSAIVQPGDLVRVPAKLEPKGHKSFTFSIQDDEDLQESVSKDMANRKTKTQGHRSVEHVMANLFKFTTGGEKIPVKVLEDLIGLTLSLAQNHHCLSGCTSFSRIDLPVYPDPLNGLYIGSHGPYTSEVIQLKRKFGQWQEDGETGGPSDLRFYEYVEAMKLTGDLHVPAGKVAFRAKIGKRYQLPHKGIIPEEFGVVARYKGQGRLADRGFQNPRWVDGELVILNGKYIKGGPVVGFVYWAPEYQFLVFFSRLRIQG